MPGTGAVHGPGSLTYYEASMSQIAARFVLTVTLSCGLSERPQTRNSTEKHAKAAGIETAPAAPMHSGPVGR